MNGRPQSSLAPSEALRLKNVFRLKVEMLRIQASGFFSPVVVVFEKTTDGTRRELSEARSRCREVDFLKNSVSQTIDGKSIALKDS
jgi:hypothetical protein